MARTYQAVTEQLYNALLDPAVAKETDLYALLQDAKKDLDKGVAENLIFTRLSRGLSLHLLANQFELPKSVSEMMATLQKIEQAYRGEAHQAIILGSLFGGNQ